MSVDKMPTETFDLTKAGDLVGSAEVTGQVCKLQHFTEECFSQISFQRYGSLQGCEEGLLGHREPSEYEWIESSSKSLCNQSWR